MPANTDREQKTAILITLTLPNGDVHRYQNYQDEPFFYLGEQFLSLSFDIPLSVPRGMGVGSTGETAVLGNVDSRTNARDPLRDWMEEHDGLTKSLIIVQQIWPEDIAAPPISERHQVLSSEIKGDEISLTLKNPANASNARVPSLLLTRDLAPELPNASPGNI